MNIPVMEADRLILSGLFARSALFAALAAVFRRPGSPQAEPILSLAGEAPPAWRDALQGLAAQASGASTEYSHLLGGTGLCPSDELSYRTKSPAGAILADVAGFYRAFGYPYAEGEDEKPDHAAMELGFVSFLFAKEAHALSARNTAAADLIRKGRLGFLTDHLSRWLRAFASTLAEQAPGSFYAAAAEIAASTVLKEIPADALEDEGAAWASSSQADEVEEVFSCDGCSELADEQEQGDL